MVCYIPSYIGGLYPWMSPWHAGMPVLKPLLCSYHPLLMILQKHLMRGTWTGRTIATSRSLLWVVGGKLRIPGPWLLFWQGSLTSTPKCWRLCFTTCQVVPTPDVANQAPVMTRQWRWAICNSLVRHLFITWYLTLKHAISHIYYIACCIPCHIAHFENWIEVGSSCDIACYVTCNI